MSARHTVLALGSLCLLSCTSLFGPENGGSQPSSPPTTADGTLASPLRQSAGSLPELPQDVIASLTPLYAGATTYAPPEGRVENLPPDLDPVSVIALRKLNTYRVAAGLAPYRYDPDLTRMAMAHVAYAKASSRAKLPWTGHFETPGQPGYSKEGHEAASTSGIAYGEGDALGVLDGLVAGPYHRVQFLRPEESRVGIGFGKWEGAGNSVGLFVTRPPAGKAPAPTRGAAARFILFPPPDSRGIGVLFEGETPDPRPGYQALRPSERAATGYPITISLAAGDVDRFKQADISLVDADGARVDCWVTDPARPSSRTAPAIYAAGQANDTAFARNFDAVFVLPKSPLKRGTAYGVKARLAIGSEAVDLAWSFTTAPAYVWNVAARPSDPWQGIGYALQHAFPGDAIQLAAGTYDIPGSITLAGVRLSGAGPKETRLRFSSIPGNTPIAIYSAAALERLSIESPAQLIYVTTGSTLLLRDIAIAGGDGKVVAIGLEPGSTLVADGIDATRFDASYLCYSLKGNQGGPPRVYWRRVGGVSPEGAFVYGPADLHPLTKPLALP